MTPESEVFISLADACVRMRVEYRRGYDLVTSGKVMSRRVGRSWQVVADDADRIGRKNAAGEIGATMRTA